MKPTFRINPIACGSQNSAILTYPSLTALNRSQVRGLL